MQKINRRKVFASKKNKSMFQMCATNMELDHTTNDFPIGNPDHEPEDIESPINLFLHTYFSLSPTQLETRSELDTL